MSRDVPAETLSRRIFCQAPFLFARPARPLNIIFIQADDLGYGDLSCYGQKKFETPHIDRMAAEGTRFTQYYSGSTVCAPSRASLMTGLHTGHATIRGNKELPLGPRDATLARDLQAAGYRTAVIGKWGLGTEDTSGRPDRQGFDESFGFLHHIHAHRQYTDHLFRNGERVAVDEEKDYVNDLFAREAIDFVRRNRSRQFFLYLNFSVPHVELRPPEDSLAKFRGRYPETPYVNRAADEKPSRPPWVQRGFRSQAAPHAAYAAMIARMDSHVGELRDVLRQLSIESQTLVLFTSDNGPEKTGGADPLFFESAGGLRGIKRDLYEGGIRVPMIALCPGQVPAGAVSNQVWAHWDFFPTALEVAGRPGRKGLDGESMWLALQGKRRIRHKPLYWEFHERGFDQAARLGDWKAVRRGSAAPLELYDLAKDPEEKFNVAERNPGAVAECERFLRSARTESPDWPVRSAG